MELTEDLPVYGVTLTDQVRTLDWRSRETSFKGKAPKETVKKFLSRVHAYLAVDEQEFL
uniref:hypothetical protein n=1 Tax=Oceanobacillus sp. FSL W7-1281 TaxID=2921698 RepID=UPI00403F3EA8